MTSETQAADGPLPPAGTRETRADQGVARHSLTYVIGSAIAVVGGMAMLPVYTHALSPAEYGVLEMALRFVNVCMVFAFLGIRQAYVRFYFDKTTVEWQKTLIATTLVAQVAVALSIMLPLLALGSVMARRLGLDELTTTASLALTAWLIFEATFNIGLSFLQVRMRSREFVIAQCARLITLFALNFVLLHYLELGLKGAILGNLIAAVVFGAITGVMLVRWSGPRGSYGTFKEMVTFGLPYIPSAAAAYVISNADRFAVTYFGAVASLGLLSLASKIGEMALSIFVTPVEKVWAPYAFAVKDDPDGPEKIGRLYTRYAALNVLLALGISLGAPFAIGILANDTYWDAVALVPIVAIGGIFSGLSSLSDVGILIAKQTRLKPYIYASCAVVAVGLQVLLTRWAGVVGAAMATTLTIIVVFLVVRTVSNRFYRMKTRPRDFLAITVAAGTGFFVGHALFGLMPTLLGSLVSTLVGVVIYSLLLLQLRVVTMADLTEMARQFGLGKLFGARR
jgi:O-antigen/teichoic acid export membrane protein